MAEDRNTSREKLQQIRKITATLETSHGSLKFIIPKFSLLLCSGNLDIRMY
jgi:hypothetical protein